MVLWDIGSAERQESIRDSDPSGIFEELNETIAFNQAAVPGFPAALGSHRRPLVQL